MLLFDLHKIGDKLFDIRKKAGMTQAQVAEAAGMSLRTYAEIERGSVNMRIETILRICNVLHITPDEILTDTPSGPTEQQEELFSKLGCCSKKERETALRILSVFLESIN